MYTVVEKRSIMDTALRLARGTDDKETPVGCMIFKGPICVASGYNRFPPRIMVTDQRLMRPDKYKYMLHAEENAICEAARFSLTGVHGGDLFSTKIPCSRCMRLIIACGIQQVYCPPADLDLPIWGEDATLSLALAAEVGIPVEYVSL